MNLYVAPAGGVTIAWAAGMHPGRRGIGLAARGELLQPGIQAYGEVGLWNHWLSSHQQSHRAGPALFGGRYFGKHELKYEAAYLIGRNEAREAKTFSMRTQYIF
jgi:hypothetical protein